MFTEIPLYTCRTTKQSSSQALTAARQMKWQAVTPVLSLLLVSTFH